MIRSLAVFAAGFVLLPIGPLGCGGDDSGTAATTGVKSADAPPIQAETPDCVAAVSVGCGSDSAGAGEDVNPPDGATPADTAPTRPEGGLPLLGGDCDPMVPGICPFPFPSNVYLDDDPTNHNPSGKSVRFGATSLPKPVEAALPCPPELFYDHDGFSPAQPPMTHLRGATSGNCATPNTIASSLEPGSPTVLLDTSTGVRVPHWVEVQATADDIGESDRRLIMLRPAVPLRHGTRYIVAMRNLIDKDGKPVAPTPVFQALRDGQHLESGTAAERWSVHARGPLYADIFQRLGDAGVARSDLQVAWDYTTASQTNIQRPAVSMRDKALAVVGNDGPSFKVKEVIEFSDPKQSPHVLRRIEVVMTVPLFLTKASTSFAEDKPLDRLSTDAKGDLVQNGTMEQEVMILVPRSVTTGAKHGLLQNGHGLFGGRGEGATGHLARAANESHYVAFAIDFFGFDKASASLAAQGFLGRCEVVKSFPERQVQGMVNQLLAMRMMIGRVAQLGIHDTSGKTLLDPAWLDSSVRAYRGDSQGGIMGATYMALTTDVTRGLLGEPGMPYSLLLPRSVDFFKYNLLMNAGFGFDPVAHQLVLAMVQMAWDRIEPAGFAEHIEHNPLPGTPAHHVILHVARGDHQVSTFGAHILARGIGAAQLSPPGATPKVWESYFGIEDVVAPVHDRSVMVEYEFGLAPNPIGSQANISGCDPHDRVRMLAASNAQQDTFFRTGKVEWYCKGACNCTDATPDEGEEDDCDASFDAQCK